MKIKIFSVNKTKEEWLEQAIKEYLKRLATKVSFEFIFCKTDDQLINLCEKEKQLLSPLAALDPMGKMLTSEDFSTFLIETINENKTFGFIIGGPLGLPKKIRESTPLISLSKMTFTHQIVRLILVEQIYRAFEIEKGSPYHK